MMPRMITCNSFVRAMVVPRDAHACVKPSSDLPNARIGASLVARGVMCTAGGAARVTVGSRRVCRGVQR